MATRMSIEEKLDKLIEIVIDFIDCERSLSKNDYEWLRDELVELQNTEVQQ